MKRNILLLTELIRNIKTTVLVGIFSFMLSGCDSAAEIAAEAGLEAQQFFDQQNFYEARMSITKAIAARDDDPKLHILKGRIELGSGRRTDAFLAYSNALSLESTNPEALQAVSQLGLQTGHLREAERAADTMLSFSPELPEALLTKGLIALVRRKHKEALEISERILATRPGDEAGMILKARTLALTGETSAALELLESSSPEKKYTAGVDLTLIELFRETSNLPEIKATFKRLVDRRPEDMALKIDYANTLYKSGEVDQARKLIDGMLRKGLTQDRALTLITGLWLEYETTPIDENLFAFLEKEGTLEARLAIARYLLSTGKPDDARRIMLSVSTRISPEATAVYARTIHAMGQTKEADSIASAVLDDDETNADALLVRVKQSLADNDFAKAVNDAQIIVRDNPKFRAGYLGLIEVYSAKNDKNSAKRVFGEAAKQLPQDPMLFGAYTQYLLNNGDNVRAISAARSFARDAPASIRAWRLYQKTCAEAGLERCKVEAIAGEKVANVIFAIDLPPGAPPTRGLFGRLK